MHRYADPYDRGYRGGGDRYRGYDRGYDRGPPRGYDRGGGGYGGGYDRAPYAERGYGGGGGGGGYERGYDRGYPEYERSPYPPASGGYGCASILIAEACAVCPCHMHHRNMMAPAVLLAGRKFIACLPGADAAVATTGVQLLIRTMLQRTHMHGELQGLWSSPCMDRPSSATCILLQALQRLLLSTNPHTAAALLVLLVTALVLCSRLTVRPCGTLCRDPYGYDEPPPSYASYDRASSYARAAYDAPPITDRCAMLGSSFWTPF